MILTFCGHSDFIKTSECEKKLIELMEYFIGDVEAELFLGGYGGFDSFAYECGRKYKESHPNVKLIFVTPYLLSEDRSERVLDIKKKYDEIIYPDLEGVP